MPPLDSLFTERSSFYHKAGWERKFAWLPKKCILTKKIIWLKYAYLGTSIWTGPGTPVYEYNWHSEQEHLLWVLKRKKNV